LMQVLQAVPYLRKLDAAFWSQSCGFNPRWLPVGFIVKEVALEHVYFWVSSVFPCQSSFLNKLRIHQSQPPEMWDSPDEAAHYHVLGL
jgi:hypothetical protein